MQWDDPDGVTRSLEILKADPGWYMLTEGGNKKPIIGWRFTANLREGEEEAEVFAEPIWVQQALRDSAGDMHALNWDHTADEMLGPFHSVLMPEPQS